MPSSKPVGSFRPGSATLLIGIFTVWKLVLLVLAALSPGIGYDTSTDLLFSFDDANATAASGSEKHALVRVRDHLSSRLVRWDAFYFTTLAQRGYQYEQEWAFGYGFSKIVSSIGQLFSNQDPSATSLAFTAIVLSNAAHLISVLILYRIATVIYGNSNASQSAFITASLHIFAPAGLFLSSPNGESLFSLLNFAGIALYQEGISTSPMNGVRSILDDVKLLLAGLMFGIASTVRSNGVLSGLLFAYDLLWTLPSLPSYLKSIHGIRYGVVLGFGGLMVALGFAFPQYVAYQEYCSVATGKDGRRSWCDERLPSIYAFVQKHYWNVGFLRYWTLPNLPLFVFALPMLYLLLASGILALRGELDPTIIPKPHRQNSTPYQRSAASKTWAQRRAFQRLAIPQIALAVLAITNYHIQIITRIASGYPLPYFWISQLLILERYNQPTRGKGSKLVLRFTVMYAIIQGGLYACFLPPA